MTADDRAPLGGTRPGGNPSREHALPPSRRAALTLVTVAAALGGHAIPAAALDADAAKMFARQNSCFKCHSVDKKKDGPAYRDVAAKYRGREDAAAKLFQHVTSGRQVKFPDGHEESHKIVRAPDEEIENLIAWILSL